MLALEICVNEEKYAVVGAEDWASLSANLLVYNSDDDTNILLDAGVHLEQTCPGEHHALRWRSKDLTIGDKVSIKIIDSPVVDEPDKKYRSDATVQESPFTDDEMREFQRKEYERLRKIFEQT